MATIPSLQNPFNLPTGAFSAVDKAIAEAIPTDQIVEFTSNVLKPDIREEFLNKMGINFGDGPFYHQLRTFFKDFNKFDHINFPGESLMSGYTFITRPRLCLHDVAITKRSEFVPMYTDNYSSLAFAIRCLLDTKFSLNDPRAKACALFDKTNAILMPLTNGIVGMSGWPDINVETTTSDVGFHSEDQTIASGYDQLNKTYEFTIDFRNPAGGPVFAALFYWVLYIGLVSKGLIPAYMDDIVHRRINYSVSIYRFVVDPTRRFITHYAKATGCFPKSIPIGAFFNFAEGDRFIRAAGNFSIPFVANKVEYNKPEIINDFNTLMQRYDHGISDRALIPLDVSTNNMGHPYVISGRRDAHQKSGPLELVFR